MTGPIVRPGPADQTPPEPAVAMAIGKKLDELGQRLDESNASTKLLTERLDTLGGTVARAVWEKLDATFAAHLDELSLKIGVSLRERDSKGAVAYLAARRAAGVYP